MVADWQRSWGYRLPVSILAVVVVIGRTSELSAREPSWRGPAECEQSTYVSEQVEALTGRSLAVVDDYDFAVDVEVAEGPTWRLLLVTRPPGAASASERRFEGKTCAEVSDAAAVAIAMTLQSGSKESTDAPAPEPTSKSVVQPAALARPPRDSRPAAPSKGGDSARSVSVPVGLTGVVDVGTLPGVGIGAALSAAVKWPSVRFQLEGGLLPARSTETTEGRGGEFSLAFGAALACYGRAFGPPSPLVCLGYELGSLSGEGFGVSEPHLGSVLWQALRAELGMNVRLSDGFRIPIRAGAAVPLSRPEFVLDDGELVHRPSAVALRVQLGFEASL